MPGQKCVVEFCGAVCIGVVGEYMPVTTLGQVARLVEMFEPVANLVYAIIDSVEFGPIVTH